MKQTIALIMLLGISFSSFAVNEQIASANFFLKKNQSIPEEDNPVLEINKDIRINQKSKEIQFLQKQWGLEETGVYSKEMMDMVKIEQENNGLSPTGIIDPNTFLHIYQNPFYWKKNVIEDALVDWQRVLDEQEKQPEKYQEKFIVVNIPSQTLFAYEKVGDDYELKFESRVVVGTNKTRTPFETIYVTSLKYNPTWTPTNNMMKKSLFKKDGELNVSWITKNNLIAYDKDGNEMMLEDISLDNKPVKLTQPAGDGNALGALKFETDSKNSIYLHDTNHKEVFNYNNRIASNGCVRVESFKDLAAWLTGKSVKHVEKNIEKENTFFEGVKKVPVYTTYSQVWFYSNNPYFYGDPYGLKKNKLEKKKENEQMIDVESQQNAQIENNQVIILNHKNNNNESEVQYKDVYLDSNQMLIRRTIPYGYK